MFWSITTARAPSDTVEFDPPKVIDARKELAILQRPADMGPKILLANAVFDLALGLLLVASPLEVFQLLGIPIEVPSFYASILGGVMVGIGLALIIERFRGDRGPIGLGLAGALAVNLFGTLALAALLIDGRIYIPLRGRVVLWVLVLLLMIINAAEWWFYQKKPWRSQ